MNESDLKVKYFMIRSADHIIDEQIRFEGLIEA